MINVICLVIALGLLSSNVLATSYAYTCEGDSYAVQAEMPDSSIDWSVDSDAEISKDSISFTVIAPAEIDGRHFDSLSALVLHGDLVALHFPIYAIEDSKSVYANFTLPERLISSFELRYGYLEREQTCARLHVYRSTPAHNK